MKNNQSHKKEKGLILPSEFLSPNINNDNKILEKAKGLEKKTNVFRKVFQEKDGEWVLKEEATPNDKKNLVYHCATEYGNSYFEKSDYPQAVSYHEIAYHTKPNDDDSALNLAASYHSLANNCFKVAKELAVQCATKAGDLYFSLNEELKAMGCYETAYSINPNDPKLTKKLVAIYCKMSNKYGCENNTQLAAYYSAKAGDLYSSSGNVPKAIEYYETAYSINPNDPELVKKLAVSYSSKKDIIKATEYITKAGDLYSSSGNVSKAILCYEKAYSVNPNDPRLVKQLADNYCKMTNKYDCENNTKLAAYYSAKAGELYSLLQNNECEQNNLRDLCFVENLHVVEINNNMQQNQYLGNLDSNLDPHFLE